MESTKVLKIHEDQEDAITLVTGLGRCGATFVMQLLQAGGVPVVGDVTTFYEWEMTTQLPERADGWVRLSAGNAVKLIQPEEGRPPAGHPYRFIWVDRNVKAQAKSIIRAIGEPHSTQEVVKILQSNTRVGLARLRGYEGSSLLRVSYDVLIRGNSRELRRIGRFLACELDIDAAREVIR